MKVFQESVRDTPMSNNTITVWFTSGSDKNPYHDLLFESLEEHDVEPIREAKPVFLPLTRGVLRNDNIDVIHLGWIYSFYMVREFTPISLLNTVITLGRAFWFCIDLLLARLLGTKLVWTAHNKYHHERRYHRTERVLNVIVANVVHVLTVKCDLAKDTIKKLYRVQDQTKIVVIPDGSYEDAYLDTVSKEEARNELNIEDEKYVYLYFGLIRPYKGVTRLIHAFENIEHEDVSLWIVGNPKTDEIKKHICRCTEGSEQINTKLEYIPSDEVQYYLNAADVLVLPYKDILNSGSAHLGRTFDTPVIAPDIGCMSSIITDNKTGLLYFPNKRKRLQESLNQAYVEGIELDKDQQDDGYTWEQAAKDYVKVYSSYCN